MRAPLIRVPQRPGQPASSASPEPALRDGRVVAITGPVVDVEFPPDSLPDINYAVEMDIDLAGERTTVMAEVALQIGEGRVRCICLKQTDGLRAGRHPSVTWAMA